MKRLIILIGIVLGVSACHKTETLALIIANAYDQTVIVSGNGSEMPIKSGQFQTIHLSVSGGFNNPFDVGNWSHDQEVKIGLQGGLKEGVAYTFLVSGEDRTKYTLTYVLTPME